MATVFPLPRECRRVSASSILLSWENDASVLDGFGSPLPGKTVRIMRSINGGTFSAVADVAVTGFTQEWYDTPFGVDASAAYRIGYVESDGASPNVYAGVVYALPAPPTSVAVARGSDSSHTVSWTTNATANAPYGRQRVMRSTNGGPLALIATVSPTATSFVDATTTADSRYQYVIRAQISDPYYEDYAESVPSAEFYTTPTGPTGLTAVRNASGGIDLSWSDGSSLPGITWLILHSTDAFATWEVLDPGQAKAVTTFTHATPNPALPHYYNVRAERWSTTVPTVLLPSAWASSNPVNLIGPPNAPGLTGPLTAQDPALAIVLDWDHNPVDASPQRKYQVRWRKVGVTSWTTGSIVTSATSSSTITAGMLTAGGSLEWQVRTWGVAATGGSDGTGASEWSATGTFALSTTPTATIAAPGPVVNFSALTLSWAYYDAESTPQAAWQAELLSSTGTVVEARSGTSGTTTTFATTLPNTTTWTVRVRVRDGAGLWSAWDEQAFAVSYLTPPAPEVTGAWNPDLGTVTLAIVNPAPPEVSGGFGEGSFGSSGFGSVGFGGTLAAPATHHVDVYRSIDGGEFELIAQSVPPNTTVVDYVPTIRGTNTYRVEGISALPSTAATTASVIASGASAVFVNGGPGYSMTYKAMTNIDVTDASGRDRIVQQFDGRPYPVEIAGEAQGYSLTLAADYIPAAERGDSTPADLRALAALAGPHMWRDGDSGARFPVAVGKPRVARARDGASWHIELDMERTDA